MREGDIGRDAATFARGSVADKLSFCPICVAAPVVWSHFLQSAPDQDVSACIMHGKTLHAC